MNSKLLIFEKVHINNNGVDILTKALPKEKILFCRQEAGLTIPPNELEGEIVGLVWASPYVGQLNTQVNKA